MKIDEEVIKGSHNKGELKRRTTGATNSRRRSLTVIVTIAVIRVIWPKTVGQRKKLLRAMQ